MKLMRQVDVRGGFKLNAKLNGKTWDGCWPTCFRASGGSRDNTPAAAGVVLVAVVTLAVTLRFRCSEKIQLHVASWEAPGDTRPSFQAVCAFGFESVNVDGRLFWLCTELDVICFPIATISMRIFFAVPSSSCSSCCPSASAFSSPCSSWSSWWSSSPATPSTTST